MDKFSSTLLYIYTCMYLQDQEFARKNGRNKEENSKKEETIDGFQDFYSYITLLDNLNSRRNEGRYNPI